MQPFLKLDCGLGEAPFWEEASNTLRFVDIVKQKLHVVDLNQGPSSHNVKDLDISIGTTADLDGDNEYFIFGGKHGYGKMNRQTGGHEYIKRYWEGEADQSDKEKKFRGNDGAVDAKGRYFVGIMRDPLVNNPTDDGDARHLPQI
jgi:sugar lactone lactonase YvrE